MKAPHVVVDLQPTIEVQAAVPHRGVALPHPCRQQQLTTVQVVDETYNLYLSKVKMKRPPCPLYSKKVVTTKSQVHAIIKSYSFVLCVAT